MNISIRFKRGIKENLPKSAMWGEPLFCTDTYELFIGTGMDTPIKKIGIIDPVDFDALLIYYDRLCKKEIPHQFSYNTEFEDSEKYVKKTVELTLDECTTKCGLTEDELKVMEHLTSAFNIYYKLPVQRKHDLEEFVLSMHLLQRLISHRQMRRLYPDYFISNQTISRFSEHELQEFYKEKNNSASSVELSNGSITGT